MTNSPSVRSHQFDVIGPVVPGVVYGADAAVVGEVRDSSTRAEPNPVIALGVQVYGVAGVVPDAGHLVLYVRAHRVEARPACRGPRRPVVARVVPETHPAALTVRRGGGRAPARADHEAG